MVQVPVAPLKMVRTLVPEFTVQTPVVEDVSVIAEVADAPALLLTLKLTVWFDPLAITSLG